MPGVAVKGGTSKVVYLPSFGATGRGDSPGRSDTSPQDRGPDITIVASSRSGGAFNFYGELKGDNYTIYFETALGTTAMTFADPTTAVRAYSQDLKAPKPMRVNLPAGLPKARLVIECVLDRSGLVRSVRVREPGPAVMTSKVLTALNSWKFRPALRGDQPVEVNVYLGFNIDTNDRY